MKPEYLHEVNCVMTKPRGSATYQLDGVTELYEREHADSGLTEREVAEFIARDWFDEDYPLLSAYSCTITAERAGEQSSYDWQVTLIFDASARRGLRTWEDAHGGGE